MALHKRELFPQFATAYVKLRAMPRAVRRSIQRRLAQSREPLGWVPGSLQRRSGRQLRYKLARSLAGAALLFALAQSAQAALITVTTNNPNSKNNHKCRVGIGVVNHGSLVLKRTIVTSDRGSAGREIHNGGTVVADDFNLFGANGNAGVSGFAPGATDIVPEVGVTVNKILGPLADNGGPTKTHALVPGSPAIDAVPGADPECVGTDQRGMPRPQGARCDIGAFEK